MTRRHLLSFLIVLAVAIVVAGCGSSAPTTTTTHLSAGGYAALVLTRSANTKLKAAKTALAQEQTLKEVCQAIKVSNSQTRNVRARCLAGAGESLALLEVSSCHNLKATIQKQCLQAALHNIAASANAGNNADVAIASTLNSGSCRNGFMAVVGVSALLAKTSTALSGDLASLGLHTKVPPATAAAANAWEQAVSAYKSAATKASLTATKDFAACKPSA